MNKTGKMKSLILLIFFAMAGFLSVWAKNEVIISTRNNSLVLIAEEGKELLFGYFGKKVSSEHIPQLYAAGLIENVAAYPDGIASRRMRCWCNIPMVVCHWS